MTDSPKGLQDIVLTKVIRLNSKIHGLVLGLIIGLAIFIATNWLVLKGGPIGPHGTPVVGPHLSLLGQFFIGYRVTFLGSLIGFAYGFVVGFAVGYFIAATYNCIVSFREPKRPNHA